MHRRNKKWRQYFADHGPTILAFEREIRAAEKAREKTEGLERCAMRMAKQDHDLQERGREEKKQREAKFKFLEEMAKSVRQSNRTVSKELQNKIKQDCERLAKIKVTSFGTTFRPSALIRKDGTLNRCFRCSARMV